MSIPGGLRPAFSFLPHQPRLAGCIPCNSYPLKKTGVSSAPLNRPRLESLGHRFFYGQCGKPRLKPAAAKLLLMLDMQL